MPVNPPDRLRLLDAIIEVLGQDRSAAAEPMDSYKARIALSLLAILRRELALAGGLADEERTRLTALLGCEGDAAALSVALCARIRSRTLDIGAPALLAHLRQTTLGKLAIDNPRYSAYLRATGASPSRER